MTLPRHWPLLIAEAYEARAYFQRIHQRRKIWAVVLWGLCAFVANWRVF